MVRNIRQEVAEIKNSLQIMKQGLHWWDALDDQIDAKLAEVETLFHQPTIDPQTLENFRRDRERLWELSSKERTSNIENMERVLTGLKATAVVGLAAPTAVAAFYAAPAVLWAVGGKTLLAGGVLVGGGLVANGLVGGFSNALGQGVANLVDEGSDWSTRDWWEMTSTHMKWGAMAAGAGAAVFTALPHLTRVSWQSVFRHPIETVKTLSRFIGSKLQWVREKWYRRWAPVPLGIGYGLVRNYFVAREQAKARESLQRKIPSAIVKQVKSGPLSWREGISIVQDYPYHSKLMEHVLPALYQQVVTPEGALVLTHTLLESFSLNPALDTERKGEYGAIIEREFERSLQRFGKWILTLDLTGAAASREKIFETKEGEQTVYIRGYYVKEGIKDLIREMKIEKDALLGMMSRHEDWVWKNLPKTDPELVQQYRAFLKQRKTYVDQAYAIHWGEVQSRLNKMEQYLGKAKESFALMGRDFQAKNLDIWTLYGLQASPTNVWSNPSGGQLLGWLSGSLFVEGSGFGIMLKSVPFGVAGGFISASYTAEEMAKERSLVKMCLPSFGALCEQI